MDANAPDVAALATQADHLMAAKMFSLACCVMLFYDILITFGDEVEKIWKQRFSFATILWFMNRYLSPLGYVVVIVSFHDPDWSKSACNRYVLYPEVLKIFTSAAIGVIFTLRLYSIYGGSVFVLISVSILLLAELAVKIWAFTDGTSVNLPPGLVGCILTGRDNSNDRFVYTWVAELIFDSIIFLATITRTFIIYCRHRAGSAIPLIKIMMRDGIIYFLVIFAANVVTVTLFLVIQPDLKAVNASFSTLITSLMVSRLILNLRNQAMRPRAVVSFPSQQHPPEGLHLTSTVIGNLGEPVESSWFDDDKAVDASASGNAYAMENLSMYGISDSGKQHTDSNMSVPGQIVVEVTRSITTDVRTRTYSNLHQQAGLNDGTSLPRQIRDAHTSGPFSHSSLSGHPRSDLQHSREREDECREYEEDSTHTQSVGTSACGWQPPQAWLLENVELHDLGNPRRSRRRPSTS
ncbi:uncharacterized protein FOMMEDRAFT_138010 [Fomitiporia mediterranea MF3/22]|uniref:uncharacterized protein n=1 Tax=Fomitiporia mediterranea (strain MF3/22) TaxID=694068 RepID=UPI0004408268|nr:uncharacterized protein FOMMEDRAFT_138010 [Fomitiporia mediterranea MF3/22]EJD07873.1 hypothetical protein FOMMEDRAFT_138010 [Fomitiporia mediterranea MF3/22]